MVMYLRSALVLCFLVCDASFSRGQTTAMQSNSAIVFPASQAMPARLGERAIDLLVTIDGRVHGRAVDVQGHPISDARIQLVEFNGVVGTVQSNQEGEFQLVGVTPGVKFIGLNGVQQIVRVWSAETAPPQANRRLMLISPADTIRAQSVPPATSPVGNNVYTGQQILYRILRRPWLVAAGTAAAIVIPIAEDDDDDNSRFSSQTLEQPDAS